MEIAFLGSSRLYSGITQTLKFVTLPITATTNHTLMAFVVSHDIGLSPIISSEWHEMDRIEDSTGLGTLFCFAMQPSGLTINPTYEIGGLSTQVNCGFVIMLSGCTKLSDLINARTEISNSAGSVGTTGFKTTKKTRILQIVGMFGNYTTSLWSSNPSLVFTEMMDSGVTNGVNTVHISGAISNTAPQDKYTSFSYTLSSSIKNITMDLAITPRLMKILPIIEF